MYTYIKRSGKEETTDIIYTYIYQHVCIYMYVCIYIYIRICLYIYTMSPAGCPPSATSSTLSNICGNMCVCFCVFVCDWVSVSNKSRRLLNMCGKTCVVCTTHVTIACRLSKLVICVYLWAYVYLRTQLEVYVRGCIDGQRRRRTFLKNR